ncbi:hypothetical protein BDF20DRAFT_888889 [Mycotypha africana]|uniref:uncharacterized protein n=1 Tax=Mycotypha africana TaxID=64632 RepID=UPI002301355F|nr:uncharacterized protein BDF20DRAFT_888889 [Mycotypha africana]KAI8970017.1 hypothetical protein BDF20DRAFT_888889 [Mycotypha africana]
MANPHYIKQSISRSKHQQHQQQQGCSYPRSIAYSHLSSSIPAQPMSASCGLNNLGLEYASYDSIRTDLSINSRDVIIADQWVVLGRIGEGSFGEVFEGTLSKNNGQ